MQRIDLTSAFEQVLASASGRMVVLSQSPFMSAAVNDNGRAALFIRASLSPSQVVADGQGFYVTTRRSGNDDYVQITAADQALPALFLTLAQYVVERISAAKSPEEGVELLIRSIDDYRRFIGLRRGRLPEAEVRGTLAEILFLRTLISSGLDVGEVITAWRGPWARAGLGVHDFTFPDGRGVEVKSTHQPPMSVRVSSPSQLVPSDQHLDLLVLPLEDAPDEASAAVHFRQYALDTGKIVAVAGPLAAEKWDTALEALSLDLSDEWYDRYRFLPGDWHRYEVKDGFPHLDLESLPSGVIDVRYSLELLRLAPFAASLGGLLEEIVRT